MRGRDETSGSNADNRMSVDTMVAALAEVCARPAFHVTCAYLFGSVARGDDGPLSDVDVAVLFDERIGPDDRFDLGAQFIEAAQGALASNEVDLVILNEAPPVLRERIVRDGRLLYASNDRQRIDFEARTLIEYLDFAPLLEQFDRILFARAREGQLGR